MKARLFFALWPPPPVQTALARWGERMRQDLGGRLTRTASVHLTLAFLGDVPEASLPIARTIGERQRGSTFTLALARTGCWRHNGIAWAAPLDTPAALTRLVQGLESDLRADAFSLESREYRPHITLLRRAACRGRCWQPDAVLTWMVDRFVLVRSQRTARGADYERIGEWPLEPALNAPG